MPLTQEQIDALVDLALTQPLRAEIDGYSASREKVSDILKALREIDGIDVPDPTTTGKVGFSLSRFKKEGAP